MDQHENVFTDDPAKDPATSPEQQSPQPAQTPAAADDHDPPAPTDAGDIAVIVEGLLFAATEPLTTSRIAGIIPGADGHAVRRAIEELREPYDAYHHAFQIEEIAGGFQIFTRPDYFPWVKELSRTRREVRLSHAALETLAVISYKQPVIRADIEDIRGVAVGPMLRNLMEMNLVRIVGRSDQLGRPMLYGTTRFFLQHFGLKSLRDLPAVKELVEPPADGQE